MKFIKKICSLTLSISPGLIWMSAFAQTAPAPSTTSSTLTSTNTVAETLPSFRDKLILSYYGVFSGPSLGKLSSYNPDISGDEGSPMNVDGALSIGFKPITHMTTSVGVPFVYQPVLKQTVTVNDLYLRLGYGQLINKGNFNLGGGVRVYAPTSVKSKERGQRAGTRFEGVASYAFGNTGLDLGLYSFVRNNYFKQGGKGTALSFYSAPFMNYKLTEKLSATLWVDLIQLGQSTESSTMKNDPITAQTGLNWDISNKLSINPYINLYPRTPTLDSSSFGMILSAKVL